MRLWKNRCRIRFQTLSSAAAVRFGVDSYSYHRLLGELREGERPPPRRWSDPLGDVVAEAVRVGADVLSLQTSQLGPGRPAAADLRAAAARVPLVLAWGAPVGLRYGHDDAALADLIEWIGLAADAGIATLRIVLGGPGVREEAVGPGAVEASARAVAAAAAAARTAGVALAVENHGDVTTGRLREVIERSGAGDVGVCFDTANALRVGEDVLPALAAVAGRLRLVHLKDVEPIEAAVSAVAGPASVAYGEGVVPVAEVLAVLHAERFAGPVLVELGQIGPDTDERAMVESCLAWLRRRKMVDSEFA